MSKLTQNKSAFISNQSSQMSAFTTASQNNVSYLAFYASLANACTTLNTYLQQFSSGNFKALATSFNLTKFNEW